MEPGLSLVSVRLEHLVLGYEALWARFGGWSNVGVWRICLSTSSAYPTRGCVDLESMKLLRR
jgi:hypothetical protein